MAVQSRSRMVSFRLTAEEYATFRHLCALRGLGNVSELIRSAVNLLLDQTAELPPPPALEMQARIAALEARLADLAAAVALLEVRSTPTGPPLSYARAANAG